MDRNLGYQKWQESQMEENIKHRKTQGLSGRTIKKSRSKEQLHLLSISEIIYDNRQKIPENDYINIMNHLKDLCKYPK